MCEQGQAPVSTLEALFSDAHKHLERATRQAIPLQCMPRLLTLRMCCIARTSCVPLHHASIAIINTPCAR